VVTVLLDKTVDQTVLRESQELDLRNISQKTWPSVLMAERATVLRLYHLTVQSLDGIECLESVRTLTLEWGTKITDLAPVFRMRQLTNLSVFDLSALRSIEGIEDLADLTELKLSGSRGSLTPKMYLASLRPVTGLAKLTTFSLANARLEDDDVAVLAGCSALRRLYVTSQIDRSQYAVLAKRLNPQLEEPLSAHRPTHIACKACGTEQVLFVGRRMPLLCRRCAPARFEKYSREFERLVDAA
jgi:hypothetical protein